MSILNQVFLQELEQTSPYKYLVLHLSINCINPERTHTPMRTSNFGAEDPTTLLDAANVAKAALATLMSEVTGQVVDVKVKDFRK